MCAQITNDPHLPGLQTTSMWGHGIRPILGLNGMNSCSCVGGGQEIGTAILMQERPLDGPPYANNNWKVVSLCSCPVLIHMHDCHSKTGWVSYIYCTLTGLVLSYLALKIHESLCTRCYHRHGLDTCFIWIWLTMGKHRVANLKQRENRISIIILHKYC